MANRVEEARPNLDEVDRIVGLLGDGGATAAEDAPASEKEAIENLPPVTEDDDPELAAAAKAAAEEVEKIEEKASPQEIAATGEEKGQPDPVLPAIEPPDSWNAEAKERFKTLPRDLQAVIADREKEQKSAFNRHVNELADTKKAADAMRKVFEDQARAIADQRQKEIQALDGAIQTALAVDPLLPEWQKIDHVKLAQEQPAEYTRLKAQVDVRMGQLQAAINQRQVLAHQQEQQLAQQRAGFYQTENERLLEKIPEWKSDENLARNGFKEVLDYAQTKYAVTPQEIHNVGDHRLVLVFRDNLLKDRTIADLQAKLAQAESTKQATMAKVEQKKVVTAPKVAKPQAQREGNEPSQTARNLKQRALKTGKDADKVNAVLAALG